ncbi:hypothetical protein L228DRAFT_139991 [Xylona heveae TC161]|uniref:Uncharacterized protein n=1 Tax=Xylona heveae (strain CBS 132557 / TC161) TaxID=1328760 RepID=A0A165H3U3_XYLHT|nr:hypothetical protein L228DRAFT_139991 [Xylona heveae TC161]KZF22949.1 hypothetical protein L228DRAFT_139991 [Xylona heveae TC161]
MQRINSKDCEPSAAKARTGNDRNTTSNAPTRDPSYYMTCSLAVKSTKERKRNDNNNKRKARDDTRLCEGGRRETNAE